MGIFKTGILQWFLSKGKYFKFGFLTTISLILLIGGAALQMFQDGTPEPFINELGKNTIGIDVSIHESVQTILQLENVTIWKKLDAWLELISKLWVLFFLLQIFVDVALHFDSSHKFKAICIAVGIVGILQLIYNPHYFPYTGLLWAKDGFLRSLPQLLHPVQNFAETKFGEYVNGSNATIYTQNATNATI